MIVGLTGSFGAGKGEVAKYLVEEKSFTHLSARRLISEALEQKGQPINRDTLTKMGNELRAQGGPTRIYELLITKAKEIEGDVVVESIRAVAEVEYTKSQGGIVIGVDADPQLRYDRVVNRASETDNVTFAEWRAQEIAESNPDDPTKQDIFGSLEKSDVVFDNGGSIEDLHKQIEAFLEKQK